MANPVRQFFVNEPEAARVVLVDTVGQIYNATGGSGGGDVNIDSVGGTPIGSTVPVSGTVSVTEPVSVDDNGGSLTVDGPLTDTELRATPVPVSISGTISVTEPVSVDDNGGSLTVDGPLTNAELRAVPVPISGTVSVSGSVTVTEPVSVDDNGGSLTVDSVDLDIRNLVFATDKVDVSGSTLAANSGVDIGDVTINNGAGAAAVPIQDGGNSITVDGTVSVTQPVAVTDNAGSLTVDLNGGTDALIGRVKVTDGTDVALVTAAGEQNVLATAQPGVDIGDVTINNAAGASAVNVQDGGNSLTVDGTVTVGTITAGDNIIGRVKITDGTDLALVTAAGEQNVIATAQPGVDIGDVTINNAAGASAVNVQDGGNSLTVDGTVTVGAITAGDNIIGRVKITDGTDLALVTAAGEQNVIATAQPGVDIGDVTINNASGASAVNVQDGGNSLTVDQATAANLNAQVVGVAAHDAGVSGNPVLVAASSETMADSAPANRTTADAEVMRFSATDGAQYVITTGPQTWSYHENSSSALTDTTVHASPGANLSLYVTDIVFSTGAATACNIFFEEGSTTVLGPWYLEATAGRGLAIHFGTPKKITAATALTVTTSAAIAHGLDVLGFVAPG